MDVFSGAHPDILDTLYVGRVALQRRKMLDLPERWDIGPSDFTPNWDLNSNYGQQPTHAHTPLFCLFLNKQIWVNQDSSSSSSCSSYLPQVLVAHRVQVMSGSQHAQIIDMSSALNPSPTPSASDLRSCWSADEPSLMLEETSSQHSNPVTILDIDEIDEDESGIIYTPENEFDIGSIYSVFIRSAGESLGPAQSPTLIDSPHTFALRSFEESYPKITVSVDRHTLPSYWFSTTSSEAAYTQPPPPYSTEQAALAYGYSSFLARSMRPVAQSDEGPGYARRRTTQRKLPRRAFIWGLKAVRALRRQVGGWVTGVPPHLYA